MQQCGNVLWPDPRARVTVPTYNELMLTAAARQRVSVVLVGARNPQNIGAAARAMQDFGFGDLRVVNTFAPPFEAAQLHATSAVAADEIMRSARLFSSLPDAISDCTYIAGTTAIGGRDLSHPVLPLRDAAQLLLGELLKQNAGDEHDTNAASQGPSERRVALLFGSEKTGLTNEQLSFCSTLLTIPLFAPEGRHLSMNLGQSVAVCLYELTRAGFEGAREVPIMVKPAPNAQIRERLLGSLLEVMEVSGYARRFPANARPEVVRQLAAQLGHTTDEAATWMGFLRQLLRALPGFTKSRSDGHLN